MNTNVRIFKLISGELIIAKVEDAPFDLRSAYSFTAVSPMILQMTHQGYGFAPVFPWCDPKSGAKATFYGETVCMATDDSDKQHDEFIRSYHEITSVVSLDTTVGNIRPVRPFR